MTKLNDIVDDVTKRITERSKDSRAAYMEMVNTRKADGVTRMRLKPGNQAHAYAGCALHDKKNLTQANWPNLGIVTAYNDMLSAHAPYSDYPEQIKKAARDVGATAQVAGGVPAMCDGVTQGNDGMELSLFSRDVIAMSTAIALSHEAFDSALYLGICDKIVPGLMIGALQFGHLPAIFVPSGPMPSGLPNKEKARIRQLYAKGEIDRSALLEAEMQSYHSPGTCTFYGTANSNQMLMEVAGLHLPGSAFVPPGTELRKLLTAETTKIAANISTVGKNFTPISDVITEKSIVNMIVGLMATGGSTNHCLHIPAIAAAAGIQTDWDDFNQLSAVTPLLTKIYPNGEADVNHFHASGGMAFLMKQLLSGGLLHHDVRTIMGTDLTIHSQEPFISDNQVAWRPAPEDSLDHDILRPIEDPFQSDGGLRLLTGPLGRSVIKISAVDSAHQHVRAPAIVFEDQSELLDAFARGELERDFIAVVRFQGPKANGMPELHKLTPALGVLQDKGFQVALVTDGRMSGASGKVPAAIHINPEALGGGPVAKVQNGDVIELDVANGLLNIEVDANEWNARTPAIKAISNRPLSLGRQLFGYFRENCSEAEKGAMAFYV